MTPQELEEQLNKESKYFYKVSKEDGFYNIRFDIQIHTELDMTDLFISSLTPEYLSAHIQRSERQLQNKLIETAGYCRDYELQYNILRQLSSSPNWYISNEIATKLSKAIVLMPIGEK